VLEPQSKIAHDVFRSRFDEKQLALFPDGTRGVLVVARHFVIINLGTGDTTSLGLRVPVVVRRPMYKRVVITHARLWDGTGAAPRNDVTVEVRGDRIATISEGLLRRLDTTDALVFDAAGRTVMPGLIDNHYHMWFPHDAADRLRLGVTSVRDLGTPLSTMMNLREQIAVGARRGPHIYATGPMIDGHHDYHPCCDLMIDRPTVADSIVRYMKSAGVDALKLYFFLSPDVLRAVIKAAQEVGLPVTGHLGASVGWTDAIEAGINGVDHLRLWRDVLPSADSRRLQNDTVSRLGGFARMQYDWRGIDPTGEPMTKLIRLMADHHVGLDPTLNLQRIGDDEKPDSLREWLQDSYRRMQRFVARATAMGVTLLAGTDGELPLVEEMLLYADAGIPNSTILQAATKNGADWLGQSREFGTLQQGKRADLLIINGDPLQDLKTLRAPDVVIQSGIVVFER